MFKLNILYIVSRFTKDAGNVISDHHLHEIVYFSPMFLKGGRGAWIKNEYL
ncbi:MAG: hypothetical protein ACTSYS_05085 [Promethearchaeota archaeon]